jgi:phosphatidate cytidylyltransferase
LRPVLSDGAEDDSPAPAGKAPGPSPVPDGAPDAPLPGTRSRRAAASRRSSGSTAALSAVPAPATSRAGRNLPAAIAVGLGLGGAVLASLLWRKEAFVVVVAAAVLMALWELTGALAKKSVTVPIVPLAVGAVGMLVSAYVAGEDGLLVSFTLTAFGVLLWRIIDGTQGAARDVAAAVFVAAYVPFLAGFATLMLASADGAYRVIVFIAVTVANDVGGYAAGVLFGRHPMAPSISPKKSWEGVSGSFALCMLVGAGTVSVLLHGSLLAGLAVGAAAAFTATLGDLSESLLKRDLGIKDMGTLLPGHGGMMDRLDSLLPTAPAVALLLAWLVPVAAR